MTVKRTPPGGWKSTATTDEHENIPGKDPGESRRWLFSGSGRTSAILIDADSEGSASESTAIDTVEGNYEDVKDTAQTDNTQDTTQTGAVKRRQLGSPNSTNTTPVRDDGKRIKESTTPEVTQTTRTTKSKKHAYTVPIHLPIRSLPSAIHATKILAKELHGLCEQYTNTKVEIKTVSEALDTVAHAFGTHYSEETEHTEQQTDTTVNNLTAQIKNLETQNATLLALIEEYKTNEEENRREQTNTTCTKCNQILDKERQETLRQEKLTSEIQTALNNTPSDEEIAQIAEKEWPQTLYQHTTLVNKNILEPTRTRILLLTDKYDKDLETIEQMNTQFTSASTIYKRLKPGTIVTLHNSVDVEYAEDTDTEMDDDFEKPPRSLIVGKITDNPENTEFIRMMKKLTDKAMKLQTDEPPAIYLSGDRGIPTLRKALEAVCRQIDLKIHIYTKYTHDAQQKKDDLRNFESKSKTVYIKVADGRSYADTVVGLRGHIDQTRAGVKIKGFNKTADGNVAIRLAEISKGGAQTLADDITRGTNAQTRIRHHSAAMTVILRDLDPLLSREQIEEGVREIAQALPDTTIRAQDPRCSPQGTWSSLVTLPAPLARELIERRRLLLGYRSCRVEEWLQVPRCFNCQMTGHLAKDCKNDRVADIRCYRCGEVGHSFKECNKESPKCYNCNSADHLATSRSCPIYRAALQELLTKHRSTNNTANTAQQQPTAPADKADTTADTRKPKPRAVTDSQGWTTPGAKHTAKQTTS